MKYNFATKQVRAINAQFQVRTSETGVRTVRGYAAVFNSDSEDLGGFIEQIRPGAFTETLTKEDVRALSSHNTDCEKVLGRVSSGTLRLGEDDIGLWVEIDLPNTTSGNDIAALIGRRDIKEMSFGFFILESEEDRKATPLRLYIKKVRLLEVSIVTWPAYPATSIRSLEGADSILAELNKQDNIDAEKIRHEQDISRLEVAKLRLAFITLNNLQEK